MRSFVNQTIKIDDYFLNEKRFSSDPLANTIVEKIFSESNPSEFLAKIAKIQRNGEVIPSDLPDYIQAYFNQPYAIGDWVSKRELKISSAFFETNAQLILLCLMAYSLPYCYAAGYDAEILLMSQRITNDTKKRLSETAQFVIDVMAFDAFEPSGYGIRSIQKVRLMHAVIRYHIKKKHLWNISRGIPINQESMAGTNLSFSLIILKGLQKLHVNFDNEIEKSYIKRWNAIGYILGIDENLLFDDLKQNIALVERIKRRHFHKTQAGNLLTKSLIDASKEFFAANTEEEFIFPLMNYLLGKDICDILGIPTIETNTQIVTNLRLKNTFEQMLQLNPNRLSNEIKNQILTQTDSKRADFQSPQDI